jgi:hypothetical protein
MTKLKELITLADAATLGPWEMTENPHPAFGGVQLYWIDSEAGNLAENICEEEAAFISAAAPVTVKRMAELLMQCRDALRCQTPDYEFRLDEALAAIDAFEKEQK